MSKLLCFILFTCIVTMYAQPVNTIIDVGVGNANAMSNNGNVVLGEGEWYWTYNTGQIELDHDVAYSTNDVNNDTIIVGNFRDPNALTPDGDTSAVAGYWKNGVWTALGQMPGVPYFDFDQDEYNRAWGISDNGQYIVGHQKYSNGDYEAWIWDESSGYTLLGTSSTGSRANAVCNDGSVVAGWDLMESGQRQAVYWDLQMHNIDPGNMGEAANITQDGTWIVGKTNDYAFRWSKTGGLENILPSDQPEGYATDVSDDGTFIGGGIPQGSLYKAFIWTENGGFQYLDDYLEAHGINTMGWNFYWVTGVSGDGTILSGYGFYIPDSKIHSFWVKIDEASAIDYRDTAHITDFRLQQNYPNPFNPSTTIAFDVPRAAQVRLSVYDLQGRKVRTLLNQAIPAGMHQAKWDGTNDTGTKVASGIYLYMLEAGKLKQTKKMVLIQ